MSDICLIVIFNHKYNKNVTILRELYKEKFHNLYFVIPFFDSSKDIEEVQSIDEDIITVYNSSFSYQGYIAMAINQIKEKYQSYVFIGDDLLLNPILDENNILDNIGLDIHDSYIKEIQPYGHSGGGNSLRLFNNLFPFNINTGVNYESEIPNYQKAVELCTTHGFKVDKYLGFDFFKKNAKILFKPKNLLFTLVTLAINKGLELPYPLFVGYSDMLIISGEAVDAFAHFCGVFAAMGLFVETAIPLSIALACNSIKLEDDIRMKGLELWGDDIELFEAKFNHSLTKLLNSFEKDRLYYHPVKLSKWK